ncbi:hypothetical protein PAP18089_05123 [Pandoraea apista]|uniref:DUF4376 domain-containing protein n=1 Tax=Pandoraea apista TaxID=93218 RepID=A0A5E5PBV7_9BURK|nr:hypothetical protein LMG16407_03279 [Pandoraea apista]VVG74111.1 hypothetical protein PAP18089_05123 [Pandoraea apista]
MGQKYAAYDAQGVITAYYDSVDSPVPVGIENVMEITDAQWQECLTSRGHTVVNGVLVAPAAATSEELLAQAKVLQCAAIDASYVLASTSSVTFKTSAGVSQTYQADSDSQLILMQAVQGYSLAGSVPTGFFWKAEDNTLVSFSLQDLEGLYTAMLANGWAAFQKRAELKKAIASATSIDAVQAINWG